MQPDDVRQLLLRTCLLDRVNGELADLLTGRPGSERILLELEDANAFVVSLDPERTWFRYHHLLGDFLRLETPYGDFDYRVRETLIVKPQDVWVIDPTPRSMLTLISCYPFDYIGHAPERFIVRAERMTREYRIDEVPEATTRTPGT